MKKQKEIERGAEAEAELMRPTVMMTPVFRLYALGNIIGHWLGIWRCRNLRTFCASIVAGGQAREERKGKGGEGKGREQNGTEE